MLMRTCVISQWVISSQRLKNDFTQTKLPEPSFAGNPRMADGTDVPVEAVPLLAFARAAHETAHGTTEAAQEVLMRHRIC